MFLKCHIHLSKLVIFFRCHKNILYTFGQVSKFVPSFRIFKRCSHSSGFKMCSLFQNSCFPKVFRIFKKCSHFIKCPDISKIVYVLNICLPLKNSFKVQRLVRHVPDVIIQRTCRLLASCVLPKLS